MAAAAMLWWSIFTATTGAVVSITQMLIVRFTFGLGEGVFPACAFKTIAVWFPKRERATASAIMLASNSLGIALSPLVVVAIMSVWGWRNVFYSLFIPGIAMAMLFLRFVPNSPLERAHGAQGASTDSPRRDAVFRDNAKVKPSFLKVVKERYMLRYFFAYFFFAIATWGFTTWLPTYLVTARNLSMSQMGMAASLPFLIGSIGSVLGGWMSERTFKSNRRTAIVLAAWLSALSLYLTFHAKTLVVLVVCQTSAGFFLMFFVSSFWALPVNTVPENLMGLASGAINTAGQIAAFISPLILGFIVDAAKGDYKWAFLLLVTSLVVSSAIALALPSKLPDPQQTHGTAELWSDEKRPP